MRKLLMFSAAAIAVATAAPVMADTMAVTTTDVNLRAGPSSRDAVVGVIGSGETVNVTSCIDGGRWCRVVMADGEGYVSSRFLSGDLATTGVIVDEGTTASIRTRRPAATPGTTAGVVTGGTAGAITGAVIGGPVGAAVGGAAGIIAGGTTGAILDPPTRVRRYVSTHRVEPVYLQDEVVVGTTLPRTVELRPIPDYRYRYVYLNERPVLVDPGTRRVVYIEQ
jgi:uncharacterized protein YraI